MSSLCRTAAAGFTLEQSHPLEQVLETQCPEQLLLAVDALFHDQPEVLLRCAEEKKIRNGAPVRRPELPDGAYRLYGAEHQFLALGRCGGGVLSTVKSFFEV